MKIKGNMKAAQSFTTGLFPRPTEENIKKYLGGSSVSNTSATPS